MASVGVIISSSTVSVAVQADGRSWVINEFTDQASVVHFETYIAAANAVLATDLSNQATSLSATLIAQEIANNVAQVEALGASAVYILNYSTQAQNDLAVRQAFLTAVGIIAVNIGAFLNTIGPARLTVAFNLGNVIALEAVLASLGTTANTVAAAKGQ